MELDKIKELIRKASFPQDPFGDDDGCISDEEMCFALHPLHYAVMRDGVVTTLAYWNSDLYDDEPGVSYISVDDLALLIRTVLDAN